MSEISLEHLEDLENVYLASPSSNFRKPSCVPCLQLELLPEDEEFPYIPMPKPLPDPDPEPILNSALAPEQEQKVQYTDYAKIRSQAKAKIEQSHIQNLLVVDKILRKRNSINIEKILISVSPQKHKITEFSDNAFEVRISKMVKNSMMLLSSIKQARELASFSIIHAVLHGNPNYVEAHLDSCVTDNERLSLVNTVDQFGRKPLHYAGLIGDESILRMLILCGADPFAKDFRNRTALHYTAYSASTTIQLLLITACENRTIIRRSMLSNNNNFTVSRLFRCQLAPVFQHSASEKPLEGQKVDISISDFPAQIQDKLIEINRTPEAGLKNRKNQEKYIDWADDEGKTSLQIAIDRGNDQVAKLLIKLGADINIEDNYGNSVFQMTKQKNQEPTKVLSPQKGHKLHILKSSSLKTGIKKTIAENKSSQISGYEKGYDTILM